MPRWRVRRRAGMSLLEVLTALAIFLLSVVAVSQMVDSAAQTALRAQRLSRAGLFAESKMAELAAGIQPLETVIGQPLEEAGPGWSYSVLVQPENWTGVAADGREIAGLSLVTVTVSYQGPRASSNVEQSLTRVILHPALRVPAQSTSSASATR